MATKKKTKKVALAARHAARVRSHKTAHKRKRVTEVVLDHDGKQVMVPGVEPLAPREDDGLITISTLRLTRRELRAHRVAFAKVGDRAWQHWALRVLNREAGVAS